MVIAILEINNYFYRQSTIQLFMSALFEKRGVNAGRRLLILQLLSQGKHVKDIATCLQLNDRNVEAYIAKMKDDMGATNSCHLVAMALRQKIIE